VLSATQHRFPLCPGVIFFLKTFVLSLTYHPFSKMTCFCTLGNSLVGICEGSLEGVAICSLILAASTIGRFHGRLLLVFQFLGIENRLNHYDGTTHGLVLRTSTCSTSLLRNADAAVTTGATAGTFEAATASFPTSNTAMALCCEVGDGSWTMQCSRGPVVGANTCFNR